MQEDVRLFRSFGRIVALRSDSPNFLDATMLELAFDNVNLFLDADQEFDTLSISTGIARPQLYDLSERGPFQLAIGCELVWNWELINQFGHRDGLQFDLKPEMGEEFTWQVMVWTSTLRLYEVRETVFLP